MITLEKVQTYQLYDGDVDMFARNGKSKQKEHFPDMEWSVIDQFVQEMAIVRRNLASVEFVASLRQRMMQHCDCQDTVEALMSLGGS